MQVHVYSYIVIFCFLILLITFLRIKAIAIYIHVSSRHSRLRIGEYSYIIAIYVYDAISHSSPQIMPTISNYLIVTTFLVLLHCCRCFQSPPRCGRFQFQSYSRQCSRFNQHSNPRNGETRIYIAVAILNIAITTIYIYYSYSSPATA